MQNKTLGYSTTSEIIWIGTQTTSEGGEEGEV